MARPKVRFDLIDTGSRPRLWSRPVRQKAAAKAIGIAKGAAAPRKPKGYERATAKAARVGPMRMDLAPAASTRVVSTPAEFRKVVVDAADVSPAVKARLQGATDGELADVMLAYARYAQTRRRGQRVGSLKGAVNELGVPELAELAAARFRAEQKVARTVGWRGRVYVVKNARIRGNRRLGADFLIVVLDNPKNPQKVWVLAVIESKSASNAVQIVSYGARGELPELGLVFREGVNTGQSEWSVERMKVFGLDLTEATFVGPGDRTIRREFDGDSVRAHYSRPVAPEDLITEHIGVVPRDLKPNDERYLTNRAKAKGIQVWRHKESNAATSAFVSSALDALDALTGR